MRVVVQCKGSYVLWGIERVTISPDGMWNWTRGATV